MFLAWAKLPMYLDVLFYYIIENNPPTPTYLSKVLVFNFVIIYFVTLDNNLSAYLFLTASWRWNSFKEHL